MRGARFLVVGFITFALIILLSPRAAVACEECHMQFTGSSFCRVVGIDEIGVTICTDQYDVYIAKWNCFESGNFCSTINAGGGGGGTGGSGGGGGGGGTCTTTGLCPAECFNCSGPGGRPSI
jgi:hypothetical protein